MTEAKSKKGKWSVLNLIAGVVSAIYLALIYVKLRNSDDATRGRFIFITGVLGSALLVFNKFIGNSFYDKQLEIYKKFVTRDSFIWQIRGIAYLLLMFALMSLGFLIFASKSR